MSNLLIHEVDKTLKQRLQEDAERHGRTVDEHARILLAEALGANPAGDDGEEAGIEHIELVVDEGGQQDHRHREHTRVAYGDITARFTSDVSTKRFGLFTRYFPCTILDICVRGARIHSDQPLHKGDILTLHFTHSGGMKTAIPARVVRVTPKPGTQFDYGVQFCDVMPQCELRDLICRKVIEQKFSPER